MDYGNTEAAIATIKKWPATDDDWTTDWLAKEGRPAAQPPAENGRVQLADTLADCWPGMRGNNAGGDAIESNNQENRQRDRRPVTLPDKGEAGSR